MTGRLRHQVRERLWDYALGSPVTRSSRLRVAIRLLRGRTTSLCRARVGTILHGHRYDGSLAERELGLSYTPVAETLARTIDWAVADGLVTRPLPARR